MAKLNSGSLLVEEGVEEGRALWDESICALAALISGSKVPVVDAAVAALLTTIDADTGAMVTALQLIDDAIYTNATGTPSKGVLVMGSDGTNPRAIATWTDGIAKGVGDNTVDGVKSVEVLSLIPHQSVPETAIDVVLDADPTSSTSAAIDIGGCTAVTIFLRADVTDGGGHPSVAFTFLFSATVDGTFEAGYVVNADDGSLDASISFSADGNARAYLPDGFRPGAMKIVATGTATGAADTVDCDAVVVKQSN